MPKRSGSAPVIVLVEDDPNFSLMLGRYFAREDWHSLLSNSVESARAIFADSPWDVALIDRRLPDGEGLDLCREVRALAPHNYLMILTGEASDEAKLEGFACGADDYVTKPVHIQELMARIRAGLRIVALQKKLMELSMTDGLTELRNRRAFDQELVHRFDLAKRHDRPLSLALLDVDHFKSINDELGHQSGDHVLKAVAEVLRKGSRRTDFVARFGGEEFVVILPETSLSEALRFAEKIRSAVAAHPSGVTVSIGVASFPHSAITVADELLFAADQALYRAKSGGRNRVETEKRQWRRSSADRPFSTSPDA